MRAPAVLALLAALLALAPPALGAQPKASLPDIEDEVMCVECGTALNVSEAPSADRQREFIRRRIAEGMTKQQVKDALVAEYGRDVLGSPPDSGFDLAVYLVPVVLAIGAAGGIALTARRWKRAGVAATPQDEDPQLSDADRARLERDMAGYDL